MKSRLEKRRKTRRFLRFRYRDCDSFAKYLSEMAAKGWHFTEFRQGMVFERGEPRKREYAVEVFPKASEDDVRPAWNTKEYAQYCEAAGWKFVDNVRKFCVFEKLREDAEPIVTDEERLENVYEAERGRIRRWLMTSVSLLIMVLFNLLDPYDAGHLFYGPYLLLFLIIFLYTCAWAASLVSLSLWRRKQKERLDAGEVLRLVTGRGAKMTELCNVMFRAVVMVTIAWWCIQALPPELAGILCGFCVLVLITNFIVGYLRVSDAAFVNLVAEAVLFVLLLIVGLVLIVSATENREENPEVQESILGRYSNGSVTVGEKEWEYFLYESPLPWVMSRVRKAEREDFYELVSGETPWEADQVGQRGEEESLAYFVRYQDALLVLETGGEIPNEEQIEKTRRELGL